MSALMRGTMEPLLGAEIAATGRTGCPAQQAPVQQTPLHPSGSQSLRSRSKVRIHGNTGGPLHGQTAAFVFV